jgi:hypothetical protein
MVDDPEARKASSILLALVLLGAAALGFSAIYLVIPDKFTALLWIGSLSLVAAVASYFFEAYSVRPTVQHSLAWGFAAMGFVILFADFVAPPVLLDPIAQIVGVMVLLVMFAVFLAGVRWRSRALQREMSRIPARERWRGQPAPSAFAYPVGGPAVGVPALPPLPNSRPPPKSGSP